MSRPDDISPKSGMELFREKVKKIWIMGGKWHMQGGDEYNLCKYPFAQAGSHAFVSNCPCPITFLGWEIGAGVITGSKLPKDDFLHIALDDHGSGGGRESWDPMLAVLALTNDNEKAGYKTIRGTATVNNHGLNFFEENENGIHEYVVKTEPDEFYINIIDSIIA